MGRTYAHVGKNWHKEDLGSDEKGPKVLAVIMLTCERIGVERNHVQNHKHFIGLCMTILNCLKAEI